MVTTYTMQRPVTLEVGTLASVEATMWVDFYHERADDSVGMPATVMIREVFFTVHASRIYADEYDAREIESLCWQWIAEQEPPYWEHEE